MLPHIHPNQQIRAEDLKRIVAQIAAQQIFAGPGIRIESTLNGIVIYATQTPTQTPPPPPPQKVREYLSPRLTTKNGQPAWSVTLGYANNAPPTINGQTIGQTTDGEYTDDYNQWAQPITQEGTICLVAKIDQKAPEGHVNQSLKFEITLERELPDNTKDRGCLPIGMVKKIAEKWQVLPGNGGNLSAAAVGANWTFWSR